MIRHSGRVITISSIAVTRALPDGLSYDASKAGLEGMAGSIRSETTHRLSYCTEESWANGARLTA